MKTLYATAASLLFLLSTITSQGFAGNQSSATNWFKDAHYGVFMHLLAADGESFAKLRNFDVDALTDQLQSVGAKYFVLTLGQNSGYFNAPNAVYDRYTGYQPGERCSARDLPLDAGPNWNSQEAPIGSISEAQMAQLHAVQTVVNKHL